MIYLCKSYILGLNGYVFLNVFAVEAYVASWIEIEKRIFKKKFVLVEAYVASWIEIYCQRLEFSVLMSRLIASWIEILWFPGRSLPGNVEAYAASWIGIWISNDISNLYTI